MSLLLHHMGMVEYRTSAHAVFDIKFHVVPHVPRDLATTLQGLYNSEMHCTITWQTLAELADAIHALALPQTDHGPAGGG